MKTACTNPNCENFKMQILPSEAKFCPKCGKQIMVNNTYLNRYQIFEILRSLISNKLGVDESEIVETTHIVYDLGADSLDVVELIMECEMKFNIDIPDDDIWSLSTVKDAVNYIASKIR